MTHYIKRPEHLQRFYYRLERRKGGKIARVAAVSELLEWIYQMLEEARTFRDLEKTADTCGRPVTCSSH